MKALSLLVAIVGFAAVHAQSTSDATVRGYAQVGGCTSWDAFRGSSFEDLKYQAAADAQINANSICQKLNPAWTSSISNVMTGQSSCYREQGVNTTYLEIVADYQCVKYYPPQPCKKCGDICCDGY